MRLRRWLRMMVLAAGGAAACTLKTDASAIAGNSPGLAGAWRADVRFSDGPYAAQKDLRFLYAFNAGGTMTESSNYDEAPPVTPAYGVWRETAPGHFEARYVFFNTKPPARLDRVTAGGGWDPDGHGVLAESIALAADGQTYESTIVLGLFDEHGSPVPNGTWHATARATRIHF